MTMQLTDRDALEGPLSRSFAAARGALAPADIADGVLLAVLPLLVVALTRSATLVSALPAMEWLPWLMLGLVAGAVIDRAGRRHGGRAGPAARSALLLGMTAVATSALPALWPLIGAAAAASGLTIILLAGSPRVIEGPALRAGATDPTRRRQVGLPGHRASDRGTRPLQSVAREETAARHRARATDRLLLSGLHHLR